MDSLDRTNVVQSLIAGENLITVLRSLAILSVNDVIDGHDNFYTLFRQVWANHANIIALQYAGSEALKTDLTRTGKRTMTGMLRDLKTALVRYYRNNLTDGRRQDSIDLTLGHYTVDVYETKVKNPKMFILPLLVIVVMSLLLLTTLLFTESFDEVILLLLCMSSIGVMSILLFLRHSHLYVDLPKYCPFELVDSLKL